MDYIYASIYGLVQGATEFLPVSSSGHLIVLHEFIKLPIVDNLAFDVSLHLATLLAVVYFFRQDISRLVKTFLTDPAGKNDDSKLARNIILATIPAALAGFGFENIIEKVFRTPLVVAFALIFAGILFIVFEKFSRQLDTIRELSGPKALIIGLAQAAALIPGISRSGATIISGLGTGLKREEAVRFSFLLSVPIIAGSALKELPDLFSASPDVLPIIIIAFIFSFISGWLAIKYFLHFSRHYSLHAFAVYRFILGLTIIYYFYGRHLN